MSGPEEPPRGFLTTAPLPDDDPQPGPRLLLLGEDRVVAIPLPIEGTVSLGRADDVDVRIDQDSISRRHALLHIGARIELEDIGSSNGTKVSGVRLEPHQRTPVPPGALIELGGVSLLLQGRLDGSSSSPWVGRLHDLAERIARSDISVLLLGETGVGKEVFARRLHDLSRRRDQPFVPLNCGAFTEQLLESELFGHQAGAFTGAQQAKPGLLETAHGGTVFLDEVGEMPSAAQVKLLRVLEDRKVLRVGGLQPRPIDVRFIAATNRDLKAEVERGRFREDLYYRLNGISLTIPPLRERLAEIPGLAQQFVVQAAARAGIEPPKLSPASSSALERHGWPGNIRELRNVIERAVVLCGPGTIEPDHLFAEPGRAFVEQTPSAQPGDERGRILAALQQCAGNQTRAAKLLGISRKTLGAKMDAFGIARPQKGRD